MPKANFVFLKAADNLRALENEFADLIAAELPGWDVTRAIGATRKGAINMTFWMARAGQVFMSHGVADKNYMMRQREGVFQLNAFRHVCVPGPWMKRKLVAKRGITIPEDHIHVVGWPRLQRLVAANRAYSGPRRTNGGQPVVLWAPTHDGRQREGSPTSSYPGLEPHQDALRAVCDLRVSLHPNNRPGGKPTFEHLIESDVVISDMGTLVYEAWALGKPVIFPDWICRKGILASAPGSAEAEIYEQGYGLHAGSIEELIAIIGDTPPIDARTAAFVEDYLPAATFEDSPARIAAVIKTVRANRIAQLKVRRTQDD